jgi:hypothetical protein
MINVTPVKFSAEDPEPVYGHCPEEAYLGSAQGERNQP